MNIRKDKVVGNIGYTLLEKRDVKHLNAATRNLRYVNDNSLSVLKRVLLRTMRRKTVAVRTLNEVSCGDYVRYGGDKSGPTRRVNRLIESFTDVSGLYEEAAETIKSARGISSKKRERVYKSFKISAETINGIYRRCAIDRLHYDTQLVSNRGFLICQNSVQSRGTATESIILQGSEYQSEELRWASPSVKRQFIKSIKYIRRWFLSNTDVSDAMKTRIGKRFESLKKDIQVIEPGNIAGSDTSRSIALTYRIRALSTLIRNVKGTSASSLHAAAIMPNILEVFLSSMHRIYQQTTVLPSIAHITIPDTVPDTGGIPLSSFIEPDVLGVHPDMMTGVYGGGYSKLDRGCDDCTKYGAHATLESGDPLDPTSGPREYTLDIERTMKNLICRNMKVIVIELDMFPGTYTDYRSGTHWNRLIDVLKFVRDELGNTIDVVVGLKSRHLLGTTRNRWGISGTTAAPNATEQWKIAINEIGDLKEGVGDYSYLVDSTTGRFDCLKGVMWDDFSLDFAKWNIYTDYKYHTQEDIREMHEVASSRDLFIGGVMYFDKFARAFAKDGIELGLSGPCPSEGGGTAGRMPLDGISANYYIPTRKFVEIGTEYHIKFIYYCRTGTNWLHESGKPKLRMRCEFNKHEVMSELVDFSDSCSGDPSTEVPVIFPDTHRVGECDHVCVVTTVSVPKYYITSYLESDTFQRLSFILEPNPEISWEDGPIFNGDTVLSIWNIEIGGDHPSRGKIKFEDVREVPTGISPISIPSSPYTTRVQFTPAPTFGNAIVLGRTIKYNVSGYLTPFIGFPKWCRYIYDYRINTINNSIAENCDLDYYSWVRMRSWGYEYDSAKLIKQFGSAQLFGNARALLTYNEPMFVTDHDSSTLDSYKGVFAMKPSRKPRFSNVLWWTPYHGAFEGFYQDFTTIESFDAGTELRVNALIEGSVVDWAMSAFNLIISDELHDPYELTYRNTSSGLDFVVTDGAIRSSWPSDAAARSPSGIEWGHPDISPDDVSWAKTHLLFVVPVSGRRVKLRLEIREEARGLGATASFGAWFNLQKKNYGEDGLEEWEMVESYDYSSGYKSSYKGIYEDVSEHLTSLT